MASRRRRYNPNQKRNRAGQWTSGAAGSAAKMSAGGTYGRSAKNPYYKSSKQLRYESYQKHLAQQQQIQAANKAKIAKRRKIGAAVVGGAAALAVGGVAYKKTRRPTTLTKVAPVSTPSRDRNAGYNWGSNPMNTPKPTGEKISIVKPQPVNKAAGPNTMASNMAGTKAPASKIKPQNKAGVQNPTPAKSATVPSAKSRGGRKAKGDAPARSEEVLILKANSRERKDVRQRRNEDIRKMNDVLKQKGLVINDLSGRRLTEGKLSKSEAAFERSKTAGARKRARDIRGNSNAARIARKRARYEKFASGTRRARAEARYENILRNMQASGKGLNRNQRRYLADLDM